MPLRGGWAYQGGIVLGVLSLFNIMLNLMLSHALSMLYLCPIHPPSVPRLCLAIRQSKKMLPKFLKSLGLIIVYGLHTPTPLIQVRPSFFPLSRPHTEAPLLNDGAFCQ